MGVVQGKIYKENEKPITMTNKEQIERKLGLTFDFVSYLIDNPSTSENLPDSFEVSFLEKNFPENEQINSVKDHPAIKRKFVRVRNSFDVVK